MENKIPTARFLDVVLWITKIGLLVFGTLLLMYYGKQAWQAQADPNYGNMNNRLSLAEFVSLQLRTTDEGLHLLMEKSPQGDSVKVLASYSKEWEAKGYNEWLLSENTSSSFVFRFSLISALGLLLGIGYAYYSITVFHQIIQNWKEGKIFRSNNSGLIQRLSYLVWGYLPIKVLVSYALLGFLQTYFEVPGTWYFYPMQQLLDWEVLFFGLVLFSLAKVFEQGEAMKKEQELTI